MHLIFGDYFSRLSTLCPEMIDVVNKNNKMNNKINRFILKMQDGKEGRKLHLHFGNLSVTKNNFSSSSFLNIAYCNPFISMSPELTRKQNCNYVKGENSSITASLK